jgi:peptidoglycan/xylan/chitin deacetylase (PgdA/CDA1 family)
VGARSTLKSALGALARLDGAPASGATLLIYHRVGGGSGDELDLAERAFVAQLDVLVDGGHEVVSIDEAIDRLDAGDDGPTVVLTFDDGFADLRANAFPHLLDRNLPFAVYLAAGLVGGTMTWEGSRASSQGSPALTWEQLSEMQASGLCTVGNHTFGHAGPDVVDVTELDRCSDEIEARLGTRPAHFAWTWGQPVPALLCDVRARFRSAATGALGRNQPGCDLHALARVPVRASDPLSFFRAKLAGALRAERAYATIVGAAKAARSATRHG